MADGRTFGCWLSGDLLTRAEHRAKESAGGNESKYVRALIERDLAGTPPAVPDQELLVALAARYHPTLAKPLDKALAARGWQGDDAERQRLIVARFLDAVLKAVRDPQFDGARPFDLIDAKKAAEWEQESEGRMRRVAEAVATILAERSSKPVELHGGRDSGRDFSLNEDPPAPTTTKDVEAAQAKKRKR